jgi:hypothetical protein
VKFNKTLNDDGNAHDTGKKFSPATLNFLALLWGLAVA